MIYVIPPIKIVDMADEIWRDLGQPPDTQIPYISFWLRANVGKLNNLIFSHYEISPKTQEIIDVRDNKFWENCVPTGSVPTGCIPNNNWDHYQIQGHFGSKEKDIYKDIFTIKYYENQVNKFLYAGQYDLITRVTEGDSTVTKQTKNDLAKTALANKKEAADRLIYLTHLYKYNTAVGEQVTGDDYYSPVPFTSYTSPGSWSI